MGGIREKQVDIIFMDPPYDCGHEKDVLALLREMNYVTEDTLIIVETSLETEFPYLEEFGFYIEKDKRYKTNRHVFLRRKESVQEYEKGSLSGEL